jgi:hypothetical protein
MEHFFLTFLLIFFLLVVSKLSEYLSLCRSEISSFCRFHAGHEFLCAHTRRNCSLGAICRCNVQFEADLKLKLLFSKGVSAFNFETA